ncbi:MAG: hypothetical protein M1168_00425 [Candidatus Marsarchaeota archaeon]|nr:hypothetical protein [Candidatus Marsarchaeota archaeon]MCL5094436.1 hypothetical protein [Candidatus Marsarchaeota archaeon]
MKKIYLLFEFILFLAFINYSFANGTYINIIKPINQTIYNANTIYLGRTGPGQTFLITISAQTSARNGTVYNLGWNHFIAYNVPKNWTVVNSSLNNKFLTIQIKPSPYAKTGLYTFTLEAINTGNYSKLGIFKFNASINVTTKVYNIGIKNKNLVSGIGQPINIEIIINNSGVSDTPFTISSHGLPNSNETVSLISLHNSTQEVLYPIFATEPGIYNVNVSIAALSSPLIYKTENINLTIKSTLLNDYIAIGNGALIFPVIYEPAYNLMYIIYSIGKLIAR